MKKTKNHYNWPTVTWHFMICKALLNIFSYLIFEHCSVLWKREVWQVWLSCRVEDGVRPSWDIGFFSGLHSPSSMKVYGRNGTLCRYPKLKYMHTQMYIQLLLGTHYAQILFGYFHIHISGFFCNSESIPHSPACFAQPCIVESPLYGFINRCSRVLHPIWIWPRGSIYEKRKGRIEKKCDHLLEESIETSLSFDSGESLLWEATFFVLPTLFISLSGFW